MLFYCHFPDKLLSSHDSLLKNIYRAPIDWLEETTTGMSLSVAMASIAFDVRAGFADKILCNSKFTQATIGTAFKRIDNSRIDVLYPAVNLARYDKTPDLSRVRQEVKNVVRSICVYVCRVYMTITHRLNVHDDVMACCCCRSIASNARNDSTLPSMRLCVLIFIFRSITYCCT